MSQSYVKRNQFQVASTFTVGGYGRGIDTSTVLALSQDRIKSADINAVQQISIIDGSGMRLATGKFVNGEFIPGPGMLNPNCPVHGHLASSNMSGSGGGSGGGGCSCNTRSPSDYDSGAGAGPDTNTDPCKPPPNGQAAECCKQSNGPIRYLDGKIVHEITDLKFGVGTFTWGHSRSYTNVASFDIEQRNGYRWNVEGLPYLNFFSEFNSVSDSNVLGNDSVQVIIPGGLGTTFAKSGDGYVAKANGSATFRHRPDMKAYEYRRSSGEIAIFNDFSDNMTARGCLREISSPDGTRLSVCYNADKSVARMVRICTDGEQEILEELLYDYIVGADSIARISNITLRRSIDAGTTWHELKRVEYAYYLGNESNGSLGDLKFATTKIKDGEQWVEDGTYYYRYYKNGESNGFAHGLKFILEPAEYARFRAGMTLDAIDSQIAPYATNFFEYDSSQRVKRELIDGGQPISVFTYSEGVSSGNPNHWNLKTTETKPDGSVLIIYTNTDGQVLLTDERPAANATGQAIVNHYVYDANGNEIQHNTPEAIASYQDYNWYGYQSELVVNLHSNEGLIEKTIYYSNVVGQPDGKKFREIIKRGNYGTEIVSVEYEYLEHSISDKDGHVRTEHYLSRITRFADEAMREPITTRFEYKFQSGEHHLQILEKKTILPTVHIDQNGTGEEVYTLERYDAGNRVVWTRDELGSVTYHQHDPARGLRVKTIQDADLSRMSEFADSIPEGWTGNVNALHIVSDFRYDAQGRLIESLGPLVDAIDDDGSLVRVRRASWVIYDDINRTVRSASGSVTIGNNDEISATTLTNPVSLAVRNIAGKTTDKITAFRESTNGVLSASDSFPRENWLTWDKTIYSFSKAMAKRQYVDIPANGDGVVGEHYAETTFAYDVCHRHNRTIAPNGTISRSVIDWRGNAIQQWVGTNDSGATDLSPKSSQPENDMVLLTESEFGGASSCSSCCGVKSKVRVFVQHVDDENMRVTEFGYDWRGRRTYTFYDEDAQGHYTYDVASYDNMDRVVKQEKYLLTPNHGGGTSGGGSGYYGDSSYYYDNGNDNPSREAVLSTNLMSDDRLLARVEQFYDTRGQIWKTEHSVVDPATGIVRGKFTSQTWCDVKGQVVRSQEGGQTTITESEFDALGRQTISRVLGLDGVVLQQSETVFNSNGTPVFATQAERTIDAVGMGPLSLEAEPKGEFRFDGHWYDKSGRPIASADFGISRTPSDLPACIASRTLAERLRKLIDRLQRGINVAKQEFAAIAEALALLSPLAKSQMVVQAINDSASALRNEELDGPELVLMQLRQLLETLQADLLVPEASDTVLVTRTIYDANTGRAVATVDPAGRESRTEFDRFGRTARTIANYKSDETGSDVNVTVEYAYSLTGQVLTLTALNSSTGNQTTQYVYDYFDRVVKEIYPDSENSVDDCVSFGYNRLGEQISKRDQNGSVHEYVYDNFGRLLSDTVTTLGNGVDGAVRKIETEYDVLGNVRTFTSSDEIGNVVNQIMYTYDENGQLRREYTAHEGAVDLLATPFIAYEYDSIDNGLRLTAQIYPSGKRVGYEYDVYGRIVTLLDGENTLVEYGYSGSGAALRTKYVQPNLTLDYTTSGALDRFGRVADHVWKNSSGEGIVRIRHGYSRSGSRLYRNDFVQQGKDELYAYDRMDQIVSRQQGTLGANFASIHEQHLEDTESWQFDETGNWLAYTKNGATQNRIHNAANEVLNICRHDRSGNMTQMPKPNGDGNLNCAYDAWNRMVEVVGTARYRYDGRNHRIEKIVGQVSTKNFFNGNWQELENRTGSETTTYVWGLRYIDDLICREKGDEKLYSIADPNWNVVALANVHGAVQERYTYDAFGQLTVLSPTSQLRGNSAFGWNRTFTGQVSDSNTGLILYRNRFYHAELGRYVTRDTVGYADAINSYQYSLLNPLVYVDPNGTVSVMQIIQQNVLPSATAPLNVSGDNNQVCATRTLPVFKIPVPGLPPGTFFNIDVSVSACLKRCCPLQICCKDSHYDKFIATEITGEAYFSYGKGLKSNPKGSKRNEKIRDPYDPLGGQKKRKDIPNDPYDRGPGGGAGIDGGSPGKCPPKGCNYDGGWFIRGCAGAGFGACGEIYGGLTEDIAPKFKGGFQWGVYGAWAEGGVSFTVQCIN